VIPPVAVDGPCLSIRKFVAAHLSLRDIAGDETASMLERAVREGRNMVVSGATGTGKTTLLNALCRSIDEHERVVTIEDTAELQVDHGHLVRMECRIPNVEGAGEVTMQQLVRNALRMRPDRIIVGEVRGPEALDMLQAMNTGHRGCLSTCHANSAFDAISRLETMVLTGNVELPLEAITRQIFAAVDIVVHLERVGGGIRRISEIVELGSDGIEVVR
jgi:pilus assembly protein CpaF